MYRIVNKALVVRLFYRHAYIGDATELVLAHGLTESDDMHATVEGQLVCDIDLYLMRIAPSPTQPVAIGVGKRYIDRIGSKHTIGREAIHEYPQIAILIYTAMTHKQIDIVATGSRQVNDILFAVVALPPFVGYGHIVAIHNVTRARCE